MKRYKDWVPTLFDSKNNYAGDSLESVENWFVVYGRNRDSEPIQESNFRIMMDELKPDDSEDSSCFRFGHWACGWYEIILVKPDSPSCDIAKTLLETIKEEGFLDEDDVMQLRIERGEFNEDDSTEDV